MLSRFDRKGNAGFALTELTVLFFDQNNGNDGGEDIGCRYGANNTVRPKPDGGSERQPPKKQSGGTVKPVPPLALLKRQRETP